MNATPTELHAAIRIAGIQTRTTLEQAQAERDVLWTRWPDDKASRLPSFTPTVYCVYQYPEDDDNSVLITLGRIVAHDLPLPSFAADTQIEPQHFACYEADDITREAVYARWLEIEHDAALPRSFRTDFETYGYSGNPKIYVGVQPPAA